jgi:type IV secretory pathway VirB4 component
MTTMVRSRQVESLVDDPGWRAAVSGTADARGRVGLRVARHRATTAHLASLYPWQGGHALAGLDAPYVGVNITDGGSAWCYDPFELYGEDLGGGAVVTNSNMLVLGEPGNGKSTAVKTMLWRQAGFYGSRRFIAVSDPKGEYGPLADALTMPTVRLHPGGSDRLNPLDPGPGDPDESLLARQALLAAMLGSVLRRDLSTVEESLLAIAIARLDDRRHGTATLADLARMLGGLPAEIAQHEHLSLLSDIEVNSSVSALRIALVKLLEHTLRGMFDGRSTVTIDWTFGPGLVIDLSSVFGNTEALPLVQMTTNAWLSAQMAALQHQGRRGILVEDEVWATSASERAAKALQARLKLCRLYGIWNILVTHRLSDLGAQADDGTSASKIAGELLADVQTRVVFRQATDQLDIAQQRLKLNQQTTELLAQLTKGRALWIVANRKAIVHHVVGAHELALTFTDSAMSAI